MNSMDIFDAIARADEDIIDRAFTAGNSGSAAAEKQSRKPRLWLKVCAVAACLCIAVAGMVLLLKNRRTYINDTTPGDKSNKASDIGVVINDPPSETSDISTSDKTPDKKSDIGMVIKDDDLIGKGAVLQADQGYLVKKLPTYGLATVQLCASFSSEAQVHYSASGISTEDDPCLEIIGHVFSACYSLDFKRLFSMFPAENVTAVLDDFHEYHSKYSSNEPEAAQITEEELVARISESAKYYRFGEVSITYKVIGISDISDTFAKDYSYWFEKSGLDISKVTKAVRYDVRDLMAVIFDRFDFRPDIPEMYFFEYEGKWYFNPLFLWMEKTPMYYYAFDPDGYLSGEESISGIVTEVGDGYIMVDGSILLSEEKWDVSVGDTINAVVYKNAGAQVRMKGNNQDWYPLHTVKSLEIKRSVNATPAPAQKRPSLCGISDSGNDIKAEIEYPGWYVYDAYVDETAPREAVITILGNTIKGQYNKSYSDRFGACFAEYNIVDKNGWFTLDAMGNTVQYEKFKKTEEGTSGRIDWSEVEKIARDAVLDIRKDINLDEYDVICAEVKDTSFPFRYKVRIERKIQGLSSFDTAEVTLFENGEVRSVSVQSLGCLSGVEFPAIDQGRIEAAVQARCDELSADARETMDKVTIGVATLRACTDNDGNPAVETTVRIFCYKKADNGVEERTIYTLKFVSDVEGNAPS